MFDNPDLNKIRKAVADLRMMGIYPTNFAVSHETSARLDMLGIVATECTRVGTLTQLDAEDKSVGRVVGSRYERTLCGVPITVKEIVGN